MYITTSLTNFTVAVLCTPTFYTFLKRADGGLAFHFIWKVIPNMLPPKIKLSFPYPIVLV